MSWAGFIQFITTEETENDSSHKQVISNGISENDGE